MTAYNDQEKMDEFFNSMRSQTNTHWFVSHAALARNDQSKFEKDTPHPSLIVDLHGKTALEAEKECLGILAHAITHHHRVIKIIHGVGSGILRATTQDIIKENEEVVLATNKCNGKLSKSALWIWLKKRLR